MEQKIDLQKPITTRPKCGVKNCDNDGWIGLGNRFVCGNCLQRIRQAEIEEQNRKMDRLL